MNYSELTPEIWGSLKSPDQVSGGYPSITLSNIEGKKSSLHIFKDKSGYYHFAIEAPGLEPKDLVDPGVNGLHLKLVDYQFQGGPIGRFIDLTCNITGYIEEFTEIVREIAKAILVDGEKPLNAVNQRIINWICFWAAQRKQILVEEDQIGLICELLFLETLCAVDPNEALNAWTGPLGDKHDFNFTDWNFEVKGTRKKGRIHIVNGIEQLDPPYNKRLGFVSFMVSSSKTEKEKSINLPELINKIKFEYLKDRPDLVIRFNELLAENGYSPIHRNEYIKFNVEVNAANLFEVDDDFPKLTHSMLSEPLDTRVSSVKYNISLEGIRSEEFYQLDIRDYVF